MAIVYNQQGLKIDVDFNSYDCDLLWSFTTETKESCKLTKGYVETMIEVLQRSLKPKVEVKV